MMIENALVRPDVIGNETEVAIGWDKREDTVVFPPFESNAWMEGDVIQETGINEGKSQVGHSG